MFLIGWENLKTTVKSFYVKHRLRKGEFLIDYGHLWSSMVKACCRIYPLKSFRCVHSTSHNKRIKTCTDRFLIMFSDLYFVWFSLALTSRQVQNYCDLSSHEEQWVGIIVAWDTRDGSSACRRHFKVMGCSSICCNSDVNGLDHSEELADDEATAADSEKATSSKKGLMQSMVNEITSNSIVRSWVSADGKWVYHHCQR